MNKLTGKKIELLPKIPKENEMLCPSCDGIGWLENENGNLIRCQDCYNGIITLCSDCGSPVRGICANEKCVKQREIDCEKSRYNKAQKYTLKTVPIENTYMFYSNIYGENDGFFSELEDLIEYCNDNNIQIPTMG